MPRLRVALRALPLALLCATLSAVACSPARGADYLVDACRHLDGTPAPMEGWSLDPALTMTYGNGEMKSIDDRCPEGGSYEMMLEYTLDAAITYTPPADVALAGMQITGSAASHGPVPNVWTIAAHDQIPGATTDWGGAPVAVPQETSRAFTFDSATSPLAGGALGAMLGASCQQPADNSTCNPLQVYLTRLTVRLTDPIAPTITSSSGSLLSALSSSGPGATLVSGQLGVTVAGADGNGSGIRRAIIDVDGAPIATGNAANSPTACTPTTERPLPTYEHARPCAATGTATATWDTTTSAEGWHDVTASLADAAGNRTVVASGRVFVRNLLATPDPNLPVVAVPKGAKVTAGWSSTVVPKARSTKVVRRCAGDPSYRAAHAAQCLGQGPQPTLTAPWSTTQTDEITGRVTTSDGRPIAGATIETTLRSRAVGLVIPAPPTATTGADGTFTVGIPRQLGSATVVLSAGDGSATVSRTVPALTSLVAPKRVVPGARITFSGVLATRLGNLSGVPVTLEVRSEGRWRTFGSAQSSASGAWSSKLRFARTPGTYRVRARIGISVAYPFAAGGSSGSVKIRVR